MANEAMLSWLLHRAVSGPAATTLAGVQHWATRGGAEMLGIDTGIIRVGACADLVFYDLSAVRYGGVWQPEFAPVLCGEPVQVAAALIAGEWRVRDGAPVGLDMPSFRQRAKRALERLRNNLR